MWVRRYIRIALWIGLAFCLGQVLLPQKAAAVINPLPVPSPSSSSYGLEATKLQPPPKDPATIVVPGNGTSFTTNPITVSGTCPDGLLIQVYDNGVMAGSTICTNGSFSVKITLFVGQNDLTVIDYDSLDQAGPVSNTVSVTYSNANFTAFGQLITLTSKYGRRSAVPGATLTWPLQLSGGTGPYAFSIDWGDGSKPDLKSQATAGDVEISHVYSKAGIYHVTVTVTDSKGVTAFIQLIAIATGNVSPGTAKTSTDKTTATATKILWIPMIICILLLGPSFWLGRRSELVSLRKKLEKDMANFKEQ